jgi:serine/threonine protein kinase
MSDPQVIGQGTYGCIHKPSLKCSKNTEPENIAYADKVSKLLYKEDAEKEMREYGLLRKIDKKAKYHLGTPDECVPSGDKKNIRSILLCDSGNEFITHLRDNRLIIMNYGGVQLDDFIKSFKGARPSKAATQRIERFWIEAHKVLRGISQFHKHGFVHFDMKPGNIVYNEDDGRIYIIDFGLMQNSKNIKDSSKKNDNSMSIAWWSYCPELQFFNKDAYKEFKKKTEVERMEYYASVIGYIRKNEKDADYVYEEESDPATGEKRDDGRNLANELTDFFPYIPSCKSRYLKDLDALFNRGFAESHSKFLDRATGLIDSYGVGFSFLFVLENTKKILDNKPLEDDLLDLFYGMLNPDYTARTGIAEALETYGRILERHDLLSKYDMEFDGKRIRDSKKSKKMKAMETKINDHIGAVDNAPADESFSKAVKTEISRKELSPCPMGEELNEQRMCVPVPSANCRSDQEWNPSTHRCSKKCKTGYIRDSKFRCSKRTTLRKRNTKG